MLEQHQHKNASPQRWPNGCLCGQDWPCRDTIKLWRGGRWRSNPGEVRPFEEWCRQRLPTSDYSIRDIDRVTWNPVTQTGGLWEMSRGVIRGRKWVDIERVTQGGLMGPYALRLVGGNVPEPLAHYPAACDCCGMPSQPVVATRLIVNDIEIDASSLVAALIDPQTLPGGGSF